MKKRVSALIIITASAIASFLILRNPDISPKTFEKIVEAQKENFIVPSALRFQKENIGATSPQTQDTTQPIIEEKNLTKRFARNYAEQLAKQNPGGIEEIKKTGTLNSLSPDVAAQAFGSGIINQKLEYPQFEIKDLRILRNATSKHQILYIQALATTWQKNFSGKKSISVALNDWILQKNAKPLEQYVAAIPSHINNLLALEIPESWQWLHLENLNLWEKKLAVYQAILNTNNDPIKALIAFNTLEEITKQNGVLQNVLSEAVKKLKNS